jgi:hypothetical protein
MFAFGVFSVFTAPVPQIQASTSAYFANSYTEDFNTTVYEDAGNTTLTWDTGGGWVYLPWDSSKVKISGVATSTNIDNLVFPAVMPGYTVSDAMLTDLSDLAGQNAYSLITYSLSNDGGKTWVNAPSGQAVAFATNGTDLRWKVNIVNTNLNSPSSPAVSKLTVSYNTRAISAATGSISGCAYDDEDNDGVLDSGEGGVSGLTIQLITCPYAPLTSGAISYPDGRSYYEPGHYVGMVGYCSVKATATTGADGCYAFSNLNAGDYGVNAVEQSGWTQTLPTSTKHYYLNLPAGLAVKNINFLNHIDAASATALSVTTSSSTPPAWRGATDVQLISGTLTNTGAEDLILSNLRFGGVFSSDDESNTVLYLGNSQLGTANIVNDGSVTYNSLNYRIPKGASVSYALHGNIGHTNRTSMNYFVDSCAYTSYGVSSDCDTVVATGVTSGKKAVVTRDGVSTTLNILSSAAYLSPTVRATVTNTGVAATKGSLNVKLLEVRVTNTGNEDVTLSGIGFAGKFAEPYLQNDLLYLYMDNQYAGRPTTVTSSGVTFKGYARSIPKGGSVDLMLFGNISSNAEAGTLVYTLDSSVLTATGVTSGKTAQVTASGSSSVYVNREVAGALTVTYPGYATTFPYGSQVIPHIKGEKGTEIQKIQLGNSLDADVIFKLTNIHIDTYGSTSTYSKVLDTVYVYKNGVLVLTASPDSRNDINRDLSIIVPKNSSVEILLKGDLASSATASSFVSRMGNFTATISGSAATIRALGTPETISLDNTASGDGGASILNGIKDGAMIRLRGGIDVYIVKYVGTKRFKRLILSPSVFHSYGHLKWEDVIAVDQATLDSYVTSSYVRVAGDSRTWYLQPLGDTGRKSVAGYGFDSDSVYEINAVDRDSYRD